MTCPVKNNQEISAYHDGELSPEDARRLEAHLAQCATCARELDELRGVSRLLTNAGVPDAPAEVIRRVHRTVAAQREVAVITLAKRLIAAAAAILIICAAWVWGVSGGAPSGAATANAWEWMVVAPDAETSGDTQQIAQWIVADLSSESPHD